MCFAEGLLYHYSTFKSIVEAKKISSKLGDKKEIARNLIHLGIIEWESFKEPKAEKSIKKGLEIALDINSQGNLLLSFKYLAKIYKNKGDFIKANVYLSKYNKVKDKINMNKIDCLKGLSFDIVYNQSEVQLEITRKIMNEISRFHSEFEKFMPMSMAPSLDDEVSNLIKSYRKQPKFSLELDSHLLYWNGLKEIIQLNRKVLSTTVIKEQDSDFKTEWCSNVWASTKDKLNLFFKLLYDKNVPTKNQLVDVSQFMTFEAFSKHFIGREGTYKWDIVPPINWTKSQILLQCLITSLVEEDFIHFNKGKINRHRYLEQNFLAKSRRISAQSLANEGAGTWNLKKSDNTMTIKLRENLLSPGGRHLVNDLLNRLKKPS